MRPLVKIFDHLFYILIVAPMFLLFEVDALKMFDDAADMVIVSISYWNWNYDIVASLSRAWLLHVTRRE